MRKAARRLRVILNGHVVDRQLRRGALHDLSKDGRAQRVKIDRYVRVVRQRNSNAFLERDGRNRLLCLRQRHFRCRAGKADLVVTILVIGQRRVAISSLNVLTCLGSKTSNRAPGSVVCEQDTFALTLILKALVKNRLPLLRGHLVKTFDQCRRKNAVHITRRRSGRNNSRTVMQCVAAAIRREHGRRERADLRQKQDRQQARQHPLQFFTCHDVSSSVLFPFCHVGLACPRMHGTLSSHIGVKNTLTNHPKIFNLFI